VCVCVCVCVIVCASRNLNNKAVWARVGLSRHRHVRYGTKYGGGNALQCTQKMISTHLYNSLKNIILSGAASIAQSVYQLSLLTDLLTYLFTPWSSPSREANRFAASQQIPRIL